MLILVKVKLGPVEAGYLEGEQDKVVNSSVGVCGGRAFFPPILSVNAVLD